MSFMPQNNNEADLTIEQNLKERKWIFSLSKETLSFIVEQNSLIEENILLSITKKDDPNILYRNIYIDLEKLATTFVNIPFESDYELGTNNVSIYTNKYFDTYSHRIINE
jgi:hypothetical protein